MSSAVNILLENKKEVKTVLMNALSDSNILLFPEDVANKVILKGATQDEIADAISEDFIIKIMKDNKLCINMTALSRNPLITLNTIEKYDGLSWAWGWIIAYRNPPLAFIERNVKWCSKDDWNLIGHNKNITMEFVTRYRCQYWSWKILSAHPNLTMEFVERFLYKDWDWLELAKNPNISADFLTKYKQVYVHDEYYHDIRVAISKNVLQFENAHFGDDINAFCSQ